MLRATSTLAISLWLCCQTLARTQAAAARLAQTDHERASALRPLTSGEGSAIVTAAWEHRERVRGKLDCSHLIHEIYRLAGFDYAYANSFDLYTGVESFARATNPQPGDLVVWLGHVGIVVDPSQHSFYSSLGSGPGINFYNSPYWRRRGPARFYRYLLRGGSEKLVLTTAPHGTRASSEAAPRKALPVTDRRAGALTSSRSPRTERGDRATTGPHPTPEPPSSIPIMTQGVRPTSSEIEEAISELTNATERLLDNVSSLRTPVGIFEGLQVERVRFKGNTGWARVRFESVASIDGERIRVKRRPEKHLWELRRRESGWAAFTPPNHLYVPRTAAVRVFAEQLASLTRDDFAGRKPDRTVRQQMLLARFLNALLGKE